MPKWFFVFTFLLIFGCGEDDDFIKVHDEKTRVEGADAVIQNFEAHGFTEDNPMWHLRSKEAYVFQEKGITHIFCVDIDHYSEGAISTFIKGKRGILDQGQKFMRIEEDVEVTSKNGKKLYTDFLIWHDDSRVLETTAKVKIETPEGDIIHGTGMIADQKLDKVVLNRAYGTSKRTGFKRRLGPSDLKCN